MEIKAIKTRPLQPPQDDLIAVLKDSLHDIKEHSIIAISSKVVAIHEGRTKKIPEGVDEGVFKDQLAKEEADQYIPREDSLGGFRLHTIKNGILIGSSGIDKSNGDGYCILWPEDPMRSAHELLEVVRTQLGNSKIGVVITDSHSSPLRNGVTALALGYAGFRALFDYRHTPDIFDREMQAERLNVADSLATAANMVMGEGSECTPLAVISDVPHVQFSDEESSDPYLTLKVDPKEDIFGTFIQTASWIKKETHD